MGDSNPYAPPSESSADGPGLRVLLTSVATVFGTAALGGLAGLGLGAMMGSIAPDYYRTVFNQGDNPAFNPVALGMGQGLGQGIGFGGILGVALVALFYWYRSRIMKRAE